MDHLGTVAQAAADEIGRELAKLTFSFAVLAVPIVMWAWNLGKAYFDRRVRLVAVEHSSSYLVLTVSGDHGEDVKVVVSRHVSNIQEARRTRLCEMSNIRNLELIWKNINEDGREDRESKDEDVMEALKAHPNLEQLTVEGFTGKKLASWITTMPNLVKIILKDCNRCEVLPPLPKLQDLEIKNCPRLRKIPAFPYLKDFRLGNVESKMILETMSTTVSSLEYLELKYISDGGGDSSSSSSSSRSDIESIINVLLKNNSRSLTTLDLVECRGVKCLTVGVSLQKLWVCDCPDLMSIKLDQGSAGLKSLSIRESSSSLLYDVCSQIKSSTLERSRLGPFLEKSDEFPWPFSSSLTLFTKLEHLELFGWENVNSRPLFEQLQSSTFPALTELAINDFKEVEALPDSIANVPSLKKLEINGCENLRYLPAFGASHGIQELRRDGVKIEHIPRITLG